MALHLLDVNLCDQFLLMEHVYDKLYSNNRHNKENPTESIQNVVLLISTAQL